MKERSNLKCIQAPDYSLKEFHEMFLNNSSFLGIFKAWESRGYRCCDKPSIDRKNPDMGYTRDNIQIMTWGDNRRKGDAENSNRITTAIEMLDSCGNKIREFESVKEAVRETGLNQGLIVMVCQGKRNHTGGYVFRYRGDRFRKRTIHENSDLLK